MSGDKNVPAQSSQADFFQRQLTGLDTRLRDAEQAVVKMVTQTDSWVKRYAELLILVSWFAGWAVGHFAK